MEESSLRIHQYRRRIARIVRRAESRPERAALLLRNEAGELLSELKRFARAEPAVVLEVLLHLLDRVIEAVTRIDDAGGFAAALIPEVIGRIKSVLLQRGDDAGQRIDRGTTIGRLFEIWVLDPDGLLLELESVLYEVAADAADERLVLTRLREHLRRLPLFFPTRTGGQDDLKPMLIQAERHRSEKLLGEILARRGRFEYSVLAARDHYSRTGDALDLVLALKRSSQPDEAITIARRALTSPRSYHRQRIQELLDELLAHHVPARGRKDRRQIEKDFLAAPTAAMFRSLKRTLPAEQWPHVRSRLLGHLHRHQKAPTLLFTLYLEEGEFLEADGLVTTQAIDPEVLSRAAASYSKLRPMLAAGWGLVAAHRRAGLGRAALYPRVVDDLLATKEWSHLSNQDEAFVQALRNFRSRHADRPRLLVLLDAAGLA